MRDSFWTLQNRVETVPAALLNLVALGQVLTKAGRLGVTFQVSTTYGESGDANVYNIGDAATFYLASATGGKGVISLPDPDPAIFEADGVTIDMTNADVIAFIAEVFLYCGDSNGNAWSSIRQANRTRFPG